MPTAVKQANFLLPADLLNDLRKLVPRGEQSQVVCLALRNELKRRQLQSSMGNAFAAWGKRPLMGNTHSYVRKLRKERRSS